MPGDPTCRPVAVCKEGRYGDAPATPGTIFVDAASTATTPDGSLERPWPTIQRALDAARIGSTIAIASGKYPEAIRVRKKLTIHGACTTSVEIGGATGAFATVDVAASGAELRGVAVTGSGFGVVVTNAIDVVLERLWVHDTKVGGVYVANGGPGASAILRDSLVERATGAGATAGSGGLVVERSVVRDTRADTRRDFGYGVRAERFGPPDSLSETPANLVVRRSVIERNKTGGAIALGSALSLEGSVVRDVATRPKDGLAGEGIIGLTHGMAPTVSVVQSYVSATHTAGIVAYGGELTIDRTTVTDVGANAAGDLGFGILARPAAPGGPQPPAHLSLNASRVAKVRVVGVLVLGAEATLESSLVLDVTPRESDGAFGDGVGIGGFPISGGEVVAANAIVRGFVVRRAARAAVIVAGASLAIGETLLACSAIDLDVEPTVGGGIDRAFSLTDLGDTWCGCGLGHRCRGQSAGLQPVAIP